MRYALIFAGQGSQSVGMGKEFYDSIPAAKALLDDASLRLGIDFKSLLFEPNDDLSKSEFTQPAIVLNSLMAYEALRSRMSLNPVFALGHSLGEFSALAVSGAFGFVDAIGLVNLRGKLMQKDCDGKGAGMMVVLGLDDQSVSRICEQARGEGKQVYAANFNCDGQVVIAGLRDDLASCESVFKQSGAKRAMLLDMSVASHCPLLDTASKTLVGELEKVMAGEFSPVISNVTACAYSDKAKALELLKAQLVSPVLYKQSIQNVQDEVDVFIELGASVLKGINKKITNKPTLSITDIASLDAALVELEGA
ncbi:ACP S-malonyltransferase [Campylobacter sp. 19-13652]|uniref:ACP S-malonyltransferase n=1 Tax=Campylobacter sp. 19-13652 TaxID=2840180 RepID=UPI001C753EBA|nr:ACP S-malonyltransferase [Campylobacter sp. 19-13652]BCX78956.1 malonyl CoA-acyl carrier protein transacylase [Campylobacter sp. 19-13652]